ncbi:MAG: GDP-mannose 4,6-dehydratase [Magnetovibrionaceae bacterium]
MTEQITDRPLGRVLVTGAGGFIGSHLVEALVGEGADVKAMVHYNALGSKGWLDSSEAVRDVEVLAGDIQDGDFVRRAVAGCDTILHLAALIGIPYSYVAPRSYVRTNVEGTLNILEAARDCGVSRIIQTSTSETYGTALRVPIDEDHPMQGQSPYSASKIAADKMCEAYIKSFELPVVILRPFNTFGPRQSLRAVIPTIISQAVSGAEVRIGNLTPTRDLTFVSDTVAGFLRAAKTSGVDGETINLGTGREISIGDLAVLIGKRVGRELDLISEQNRLRPEASEVERLLSDNTKAKNLLHWAPQVSLEEGLDRTIAWVKDQGGLNGSGYVV